MKAIIHIGSPKTGSKTLQRFLERNRDFIKKQAIYVPKGAYEDYAQHLDLSGVAGIPDIWKSNPLFSFSGYAIYAFIFGQEFTSKDQDKLWKKCRNEIRTNCCMDDRVLFSNEGLTSLSEKEIEKLAKLMETLFDDVTIVLYLRRQPEFLISLYSVFAGVGSPWNIFDYLDMPEDHSLFYYNNIVKRWSVFGKDKLKIRVFDKQEFHNNDLLADFAHTVGFDMTGLERVENENISYDSTLVEFLRLFNSHIPSMIDPWTSNLDYIPLGSTRTISEKNKKSWHLTRSEAQQILDRFREGNDWIAREYLGREKLFDEDVSMYPEEVASPHGLTLERCAEITAHLWKERCGVIHQLEQGIQNHQQVIQNLQQDIQNLQQENQKFTSENHRHTLSHTKKYSIYWHYYRCKILAKLTLGKKRRHYKAKRDIFHEKIRQIREFSKAK